MKDDSGYVREVQSTNNDIAGPVPEEKDQILYDEDGRWTADEVATAAKILDSKTKETKYFIMVNMDQDPFDPNTHQLTEQDKMLGKPVFAFKQVEQPIFHSYIRYLQTRNKVHLDHVRRTVTYQ